MRVEGRLLILFQVKGKNEVIRSKHFEKRLSGALQNCLLSFVVLVLLWNNFVIRHLIEISWNHMVSWWSSKMHDHRQKWDFRQTCCKQIRMASKTVVYFAGHETHLHFLTPRYGKPKPSTIRSEYENMTCVQICYDCARTSGHKAEHDSTTQFAFIHKCMQQQTSMAHPRLASMALGHLKNIIEIWMWAHFTMRKRFISCESTRIMSRNVNR